MSRSYRSVAAQVAESKRLHPEDYCPVSRCLWRTGGGSCPRHTPAAPVTAASVLTDSCPSLTEEFRDELLTVHGISASEALRINALIREWGDEPNNLMGPDERKAELRARILAALGAS